MSTNIYKALLIILVAACLSSCVNSPLVQLPKDQYESLAAIAAKMDDGSPPHPVKMVYGVNTALNGQMLFVDIPVSLKGTGLGYKVTEQEEQRAERECLRIIENFRKAGLPAEFSFLLVKAEIPEGFFKPSLDFSTSSHSTTLCSFAIKQEGLKNGSPPKQTVKGFKSTNTQPATPVASPK